MGLAAYSCSHHDVAQTPAAEQEQRQGHRGVVGPCREHDDIEEHLMCEPEPGSDFSAASSHGVLVPGLGSLDPCNRL